MNIVENKHLLKIHVYIFSFMDVEEKKPSYERSGEKKSKVNCLYTQIITRNMLPQHF